jgi:serine protease Do
MSTTGLGEVGERARRYTVLVQPGGRGSGSGVIWSSDGLIVTNAHVARGTRLNVSLWDGREFAAEVTARDPRHDLAALRIPATGLSHATAADSTCVRPGEVTIAVGNPLGFLGAMTIGVVHAVGPLRGLGAGTWVQADVRLAPGNSGGPLVDVQGRVIGINTMAAGRLALAIPSNEVLRFLTGNSDGRWLGVSITPVHLPGANPQEIGLVVLGVEPGSPAALASLLPGDILLGTEETEFSSVEHLARVLWGIDARALRLKFLRGDYSNVRKVTISLNGRGRGSIAA